MLEVECGELDRSETDASTVGRRRLSSRIEHVDVAAEGLPSRPIQVIGAGGEAIQSRCRRCYHCADSWPKPARCLACCCCWSLVGLKKMVTDGSTLELATAFVLGESFGAMIASLANSVISPLVLSIFDWNALQVQGFPGFILLTNPNKAAIISAVQAVEQGCRIIDTTAFFNTLFSFFTTILTLYWVVTILRSSRSGRKRTSNGQDGESPESEPLKNPYSSFLNNSLKNESADAESNKCEWCMEPMHPMARRCPHCTAFVDDQLNERTTSR